MSDGSQDRRNLLLAIGSVSEASAWMTWMVQQIATAVTGTELLGFIMQDATIGSQISDVERLVKSCNSGEWVSHPPFDVQVQDRIIELLPICRQLSTYRNRVVHDIWEFDERRGRGAVVGRHPTRFSRYETESTIDSFYRIVDAMNIISSALSAADAGIHQLRKHTREYLETRKENPIGRLEDDLERGRRMAKEMKSGKLAGWHWVKKELKYK